MAAQRSSARPSERLTSMLAVLCLVTFLVTGTGTSRAPFLLDMTRDLESSLAAVANLVGLSSITWGIASLFAGPLSARFERRFILMAGVGSLALSMVALAAAPNYLLAALAVAWGGFSGGTYSSTVYATVADFVPAEQRGRSLGWIMTGQSLALVVGVPLATLIGALGGWRGASLVQGLAAGLMVAAIWLSIPRAPVGSVANPVGRASLPIGKVLTRPVLVLLGAGIAERVCYVAMAIYLATFLLTSYSINLQELALALMLVAVGNVLGNLLGSQLADRWPDRTLVVAGASLGTTLLALPLFWWQPGLVGSIALGFGYALINALGRPALVASLSLVPAAARGTVLGLNVTAASIGWLATAAIGGWLITTFGFGSLGLLGALMGLIGAALALLARRLIA